MKLASDGAYDGTMFHRVIKYGIIQGGDPLSKDPAKAKLYGTGGLGVLKAEMSGAKVTRGAVAAVLQPGKPDSAGSQFFVCVTDQPALDGKYTVFGRVVRRHGRRAEDLRDAGDRGRSGDRARRDHVGDDSRHAAAGAGAVRRRTRREQLAQYRAVLETSAGPITVEFFRDQGAGARPQLPAPGVSRRLRRHRVSPRRARASRFRPAP